MLSAACASRSRASSRASSSILPGSALALPPLQVAVPLSETTTVTFALGSLPERSTANRSADGAPQPARPSTTASAATPPHTTTSRAPAVSRRKRGVDITPSSRRSTSARSAPVRLDRRGARPQPAVLELGGRPAQLGERARERVVALVGLGEHHRQRAEGHEPARGLAAGGGAHEQRQRRVQALRLAGLQDRGQHLRCRAYGARARRPRPSVPDPAAAGAGAAAERRAPATRWSCWPPTPRRRSTSAALAADEGLGFAVSEAGGVWRITLRR